MQVNNNTLGLIPAMFLGLLQDLSVKHRIQITIPSLDEWFGSQAKMRSTVAALGCIGKLLDSCLARGGTEPWEVIKTDQFDEATQRQDIKDWSFDLAVEVAIQSSPLQAKILRQVFLFYSKLNLPHEQAAQTQAFLDFVGRDRDLGSFWTSDRRSAYRNSNICYHAREFVTRVLSGMPRSYKPKHGPGAVAGGEKGIFEKMRFRYRPSTRFPFDEWFFLSPTHVVDTWGFDCRAKPDMMTARRKDLRLSEHPKAPLKIRKNPRRTRKGGFATAKWFDQPDQGFRSCSRVIAVPKDFRGPRIICAEPKENQWLQQGIWETIADRVHTHPYTKHSIDFEDQELSRSDALRASITNERSTIDLKEASDRISLDLVYCLFGDSQIREFYLDMLDARSRSADVNGVGVVKLRKFASMGSALCFPIQSLVFLALCVGAVAATYTSNRVPYASLARRFRVFGDDIILPRGDASLVIEALTMSGLVLNMGKCCLSGAFKESCGMDAYLGICVTPIRWRTVVGRCISAADLAAIASSHNQLRSDGYARTADAILAEMRVRLPRLLVLPENWGTVGLPFGAFLAGRQLCARIRWSHDHHTLYAYTYRAVAISKQPLDGWLGILAALSSGGSARARLYARSYCKDDRLNLTWVSLGI